MSKCPICGKTTANAKCDICGFDTSRDYEGFPTLTPLPAKLPSRKDFARKYLAQPDQIVPADTALSKDVPRQQAAPARQEKKEAPAANPNYIPAVTPNLERERKPQTVKAERVDKDDTGTKENKPGWKLPALAAAALVATGILFFSLSGGEKDPCANGHSWNPADCDSPRVCKICGETAGTALGHSWRAADCDSPRTCKNCGETEGSALGHDWTAADCDSPRICKTCGETQGAPNGHIWFAADCDSPQICQACGETQGSALGHSWLEADCDTPKTCQTCGATEGNALEHQWKDATTTAPETCSRCGATRGERLSASNEFASYNIDDRFFFGSYEQDGSRGNGSEPIEWIVLDKEDDRILVVAYRALDCRQYHSKKADVTWATCDLREWLNSEFYEEAFTEEERKLIPLSTVPADPHPTYNTNPGPDTQDYVFLLSAAEVEEYFGYYLNRRCWATDYAKSQGAQSSGAPTYCTWWLLRTPNDTASHVAVVNTDSYFGGARVESEYGAVRPAIWIRTTS